MLPAMRVASCAAVLSRRRYLENAPRDQSDQDVAEASRETTFSSIALLRSKLKNCLCGFDFVDSPVQQDLCMAIVISSVSDLRYLLNLSQSTSQYSPRVNTFQHHGILNASHSTNALPYPTRSAQRNKRVQYALLSFYE